MQKALGLFIGWFALCGQAAAQDAVACAIPILDHVLFDAGKATLTDRGKATCDLLVEALKQQPEATVIIEGHTCDIESRVPYRLAQRRADAARRYIERQGIDGSRVTTHARGDALPAVPNDCADNRNLNRRVVLIGDFPSEYVDAQSANDAQQDSVLWVTVGPETFDPIHFDEGKAALPSAGAAELDKLIEVMKSPAYSEGIVTLEGHTCDTGTDEANMALGQRRAEAAWQYLVEHGIKAERLVTVSYGESNPTVPNDSPANRNINDRVIIKHPFNGYCIGAPAR